MARELNRGEIWLYTFKPPDKRRPVLIISRQAAIRFLRTVVVAPVTTTMHGSPAEVKVGLDEGLKHRSAINLDHIQTVDKSLLRQFLGTLDAATMRKVCRAVAIATGCG